MATVTNSAEPARKSHIRSFPALRGLWIIAAFSLLLVCTRGPSIGDTIDYAKEVAENIGRSPFGRNSSLWEFGHLLWRPLGLALYAVSSPVLSALTDWTPLMMSAWVLTAVSALCGVVTVYLWYQLLLPVVRSRKTSFLITLAVACTHGFLLYTHSGCAYIPGLMCVTASLYCLKRESLTAAAVFYAVGALLWFPYILAGPGLFAIVVAPDNWSQPLPESFRANRLRRAFRFTIISALIVIAVCFMGTQVRRITSVAEARAWMSAANHGFAQSQRAARLVTGLPRSFYFLDKDGILLKRFLRHDPYAPVGLASLLRTSMWKIAAFFLFIGCLFLELRKKPRAVWAVIVLGAGSLPVLFFAIFLFEPSMPERYLPAYPFLLLAVGSAFGDFPRTGSVPRFIMAAVLTSVVFNNVSSFAAPRVTGMDAESWQRVAQLRTRLRGASEAIIVTNQDRLEEYIGRSIFGRINRPDVFRTYDVIEPGSLRMLQWREEFAAEALRIWKNGGEVWLSQRLFSAKPEPDWNWVEGDDPKEIWTDLPKFFGALQTDAALDGKDGFARLARNAANEAFLTPVAASCRPPLTTVQH